MKIPEYTDRETVWFITKFGLVVLAIMLLIKAVLVALS